MAGRFVAGAGLLCRFVCRGDSYNLSTVLTRRRLARCAESQGLRLVSFSSTPSWKGPRAWRRNRYKVDYRIVVETRSGLRREGWLLEDWPFLNLGRPEFEVQLDDVRPDAGDG